MKSTPVLTILATCLLTAAARGDAELPNATGFEGERQASRSNSQTADDLVEAGFFSPVSPGCELPQPLCFQGANCCCEQSCCDLVACEPCCKIKLIPYGWLFEAHGSATVRGVTGDVSLSTRDMLNILEHNLHFGEMGRVEIEQGPWTLLVDNFFMNVGFGGAVRRFAFAGGYEEAMVETALAYELQGVPEMLSLPSDSRFDVLAGTRYHLLRGDLTVTGPLGNTATADGHKDWIDPIVGGRLTMPLSQTVTMQLRGDIGGFDWGTASELTWNAEAVFVCQCTETCSLIAGYRILDIKNERGSGDRKFAFDMQFRGPMSGVIFEF